MKNILIILFIFLLLLVGTGSAQNTSELPTFSEDIEIGPPQLPDYISGPSLILELKDVQTKTLLADSHVKLELINQNTGENIKTIKYCEDGILEEIINEGNWNIIIKLDKISTKGKDYYSEIFVDLKSDESITVYMQPVGSIRGTVYKNNKVTPGARIKFDCSGDYGDVEEVNTDDFGSFKGDWLPIGSCKVSALHGNWVGDEEIIIETAILEDIQIDLTSEIAGNTVMLIVILIIIVTAIIGGYTYYKHSTVVKKEKTEDTFGIPSNMHNIMKTLKKEEKEVVQSLIDNEGESTQAKVYHATGIPKASLSRYVQSLENKKIIQTKMLGKVKKLELTPWFLGKEEK